MAKAPAASWFALGILFVVAVFNYVDRSVLSVLQVPIKKELNLSDTQLGALTGLAFAILYTTLSLPIARLADKTSRAKLLSGALAIWSGMTALTGFTSSFAGMVACRMGVAFGEAGCMPASHSLISDYFPKHRRATAIALWGLSLPLGMMIGLAAGGWLAAQVGWRNAFVGLGVFGLVLAPLVLIFLREPRRGQFDPPALKPHAPAESAMQQIRVLWNLKAFRYAAVAGAMIATVQHSMFNWNAPFYDRVFNLPIANAAFYLALITGIGGGLGSFFGGVIADRLGARDVRWYFRAPAVAAILVAPAGLLQFFAPSLEISLAGAALAMAASHGYLASMVATTQTIVSPHMRAFASATLVMTVNLIGLGLGPVAVGAMSDYFSNTFGLGTDSLRYAAAVILVFCLPAAFYFWKAADYLVAESSAGKSAATLQATALET